MTDKEKLYAVKDDEGRYLLMDEDSTPWWNAGEATAIKGGALALSFAEKHCGHVVKLVEAPEKVVVNAEEAEMLEQAKCDDYPAELIVGFVNSRDNYDDDRKAEDRLMRAYVNGYTVANEKKYNVKVPHTKYVWYYKPLNADLRTISNKELCSDFTEAEIEQYGLQYCEKVECDNDD